jgi:hypothetical protein
MELSGPAMFRLEPGFVDIDLPPDESVRSFVRKEL